MRDHRKTGYLLLLLVLFGILAAGCASAADSEEDTSGQESIGDGVIRLYYLDADEDSFHTVDYTLENTEDPLLASYEVVSKPAIYDDVVVNSISIDGVEETVDLGVGYRQLDAAEAILLRAAMVKSLVQIDGVESVRFTINGDSLLDSDDNPIGPMTKDTFILEEEADSLYDSEETVTLYYADMEGSGLIEYKTQLSSDDNMPMETRVLLELMTTPENTDMQSPLPSDLVINQTQIHNGVCYVDLSKDIENALPGVEEKVMVYAMVNSITALGNATSVQFTVDGEKMESLRDFDSFHLMMTNDYSLVDSAIKGTKQ